MRVAVLGSWRPENAQEWDLRGTAESFGQACHTIGHQLLKLGHSLILGSDSTNTADGHALAGARQAWNELPAVERARPRIMMIRQEKTFAGRDGKYIELHQTLPGGIVDYPVDTASFGAVKQVQAHLADAVILVGGAHKTEQAGLAATIGRKPLACIGSFGGAAYKLNRMLAPNLWSHDDDTPQGWLGLQVPFDDHVLQRAFERAGVAGGPKLMIIHGRSTDRDVLKRYLQQYVRTAIVLTDEFNPTQPITLKFERAAASVDGAIALLTPDDKGALADGTEPLRERARENVWLEVGWFWGRRGRSKLLLLSRDEVNIPSDLGNVEHYRYQNLEDDLRQEGRLPVRRFLDRLHSASDR